MVCLLCEWLLFRFFFPFLRVWLSSSNTFLSFASRLASGAILFKEDIILLIKNDRQRVLNDLLRTKHSRRHIIWLLPHLLSCQQVLSLPVFLWSFSLTGEEGRRCMGEESNHMMAREPGSLWIIPYSLVKYFCALHTFSYDAHLGGVKQYDSEKAWFSINNSILSFPVKAFCALHSFSYDVHLISKYDKVNFNIRVPC